MGRRVTAAAAGVMALALLGAAAAGTRTGGDVPKLPPYVLGNGGSFRVESNAHWGHVRQFIPRPSSVVRNESIAAIWATTCSHGEQIATFSRTITIPGPPADASFALTPLWGSFAQPFEWAELNVNGHLLLHRPMNNNSFTVKLDNKTVRHAFRFGANEIDVRVQRRALPATIKQCNAGGKDWLREPTHLGVLFALYGDFVADLALEPKAKAEYKRVSIPADKVTAQGAITFVNKGPSGVVDAKFSFTTTSFLASIRRDFAGDCKPNGPDTEEHDGAFGPSFSASPSSRGSVSFICDIRNLPPGASRTATILVANKVQLTQDFSDVHIYVGWAIFGTASDPDITDNNGREDLVFCGKLSTLEGCKTAKP